jgi:hypothetical protein
MGVALQAWKGMGDWQKPLHTMRALFPMYDTSFQFTVLRRSGISSVAMLDKVPRIDRPTLDNVASRVTLSVAPRFWNN